MSISRAAHLPSSKWRQLVVDEGFPERHREAPLDLVGLQDAAGHPIPDLVLGQALLGAGLGRMCGIHIRIQALCNVHEQAVLVDEDDLALDHVSRAHASLHGQALQHI